MTQTKIQIHGKEFVQKLLAGERDFSNIWLYQFKAQPYIKQLNDYLKAQDLKNMPVILDGSNLVYAILSQIYLPHLHAVNARFNQSSFGGAVLSYANLRGTHFENTTLSHAQIDHAVLLDTTLTECILDGTILKFSELAGAKAESCAGEKLQIHGIQYLTPDGTVMTQKTNRASAKELELLLSQHSTRQKPSLPEKSDEVW